MAHRQTVIRRNIDHAAQVLETAVQVQLVDSYTRLVDGTAAAVDALLYVAIYGRHEDARVSAAKEILDRADLTPQIRVSVTEGNVDERSTRIDELRKSLQTMAVNLTSDPIEATAEEA